jgi:hypothetical protein
VIISRRRWGQHVASVGDRRGACMVFVERPDGDLGVERRIILK